MPDIVNFKFRPNASVEPERLAQFVASHRGAQFTPDGTLKFVLKATAAGEVLQRLHEILEQLASAEAASEVGSTSNPKT